MSAENMFPIERDDASADYFDAAAEDRLLIRRCSKGHLSAPQSITCPVCFSADLGWQEASKDAEIVTFAIIERRDQSPLPVAIVQLAEGPWLRLQLQNCDAPEVGQAMRIKFATPEGGEPLPYAVPA